MIAENYHDNEVEEKQLTPQEMRSLLHILLTVVKGITIPQQTFDEYDAEAKINITFDEENEVWRLWVPSPKHRGIVVPKKKMTKPKLRILRP